MSDSLKTMVARIEERQIGISDKIEDIKKSLTTHMEQDSKEFAILRKKIGGMTKYAASVAIVAGAIGWLVK